MLTQTRSAPVNATDRRDTDRGQGLAVNVVSIGTAVPPIAIDQAVARDVFAGQHGRTAFARRAVTTVFNASAIDRRHTVLDEFAGVTSSTGGPGSPSHAGSGPLSKSPSFYDPSSGALLEPSTGERMRAYEQSAPPLLVAAAEQAIREAPGVEVPDITHVITVSCTGFFAPGPDHLLVRALGLNPATRRLHIGFMGCYGAFPALRAAVSTCIAEPAAVVLVVCVELCTLHLRSSDDPDTIVASSVFADGAAAAIVTAQPLPPGSAVLRIDAMETTLTDGGDAEMAWRIGDLGFDMVLSSYVPRIIEKQIETALQALLDHPELAEVTSWQQVEQWAIHPGGRSILDRVQRGLELADHQLVPSREVLRDYGNMSSATVLFILRKILLSNDSGTDPRDSDTRVATMAFGPGLTIESAILTRRLTR